MELSCCSCFATFSIAAGEEKKYQCQDDCMSCSAKCRNVLNKPSDEQGTCFRGLHKKDPNIYRHILVSLEKVKAQDRLASYKEGQEQSGGHVQECRVELMMFSWYNGHYLLLAWSIDFGTEVRWPCQGQGRRQTHTKASQDTLFDVPCWLQFLAMIIMAQFS